jgi:hypothetical protein
MTPQTMHLLSQLIRHSRGMLSAFEQWMVWRYEQDEKQISAKQTDKVPTTR